MTPEKSAASEPSCIAFLFAASVLFAATILAVWQANRRLRPLVIIPTLTGQPEYCLTCHADLPEISPSHPVQAFGCVRCHGGERLALDADLAHRSMRGGRNPSDFSVVEESCGGKDCHSGEAIAERDHIQRVRTSLQATYAGAVASIRFTFGAQPDLTVRLGILPASIHPGRDPIGTTSSATSLAPFDPNQEDLSPIKQFAANCLTCHLSAQPLPGEQYARFTGCAACHTPTAGRPDLFDDYSKDYNDSNAVHRLTTAIPYTQCNTCHNRGNYDLRLMQFHPRQDQPSDRISDYYQPIAQFTRCEYKLDCVDCHTRLEAMGDGFMYNNQKDMQVVQCRDCHGTPQDLPRTTTVYDPNDIAFRLSFLNPVVQLKPGDQVVLTSQGEPLWNYRRLPNGQYLLVGKASGVEYIVPLVKGTACEQKPEDQESRYCHACHAIPR